MTQSTCDSTSLSNKLEMLLELYDEGQLPPDEQIQLATWAEIGRAHV